MRVGRTPQIALLLVLCGTFAAVAAEIVNGTDATSEEIECIEYLRILSRYFSNGAGSAITFENFQTAR